MVICFCIGEEHPLLSTIYDPSSLLDEGDGTSTILVHGNQIPTVFTSSGGQESSSDRLLLLQGLISESDLASILHPNNGPPLDQGSDYKLVKKIIQNGEEWTGSLPSNMVSTMAQKIDAINKGGFSLIINALEARWATVANFSRFIEQDVFPEHVSCNLYMTPKAKPAQQRQHEPPPSSSGFESHWDWMDVIVMQISGEKLWSVAKTPKVQLSTKDQKHKPTLQDMNEYLNYETGRYDEFLLRPGDVLYIPRGFIHNASTVTTTADTTAGENASQKNDRPWHSRQPSLHLTFGIEYGCSTTYEALIHHAIELYDANSNKHRHGTAISSRKCPAAQGRSIPWKDVVHFVVAEVSRRQEICPTTKVEPNSCILRKSAAIHPHWKELTSSRRRPSPSSIAMAMKDDAVKDTMLDALSAVLDMANPERTSRFVWRLEAGEGESIRSFCHPYIGPHSTVPCVEALAEVDATKLRSYLLGLRDYASQEFDSIQNVFESQVKTKRKASWAKNDERLRTLGQSI